MAKSAMKAHQYKDAIRYCDEGIDALRTFKKLVKDSGADKDAVKSSHAIAAGANCVKVVLALLLAASAVFISAKAVKMKTLQKRIKTDETMLGVANTVADAANSKLDNVNNKNKLIDHRLTAMSDELDRLSNTISDAQMSTAASKGYVNEIDYKTQQLKGKLKSSIDNDRDSALNELYDVRKINDHTLSNLNKIEYDLDRVIYYKKKE